MADREKLIELIRSGVACPIDRDPFGESCKGCPYEDVTDCDFARLADALIANGVTVRERGRWIQRGKLDEDGNGQYYCSVCSAGETHNPIADVPYCWKCGSDMRGEEDGT